MSKGIDAAATDVQSAIQRASGQLPTDLPSPPTFTKTNPNDQPVMYIALTSDTLTDGELYRYATTEVQQRINILPGVSAGQHLRREGRDSDQGRSRRARRAQHDLRRTRDRDSRRHRLLRRGPVRWREQIDHAAA